MGDGRGGREDEVRGEKEAGVGGKRRRRKDIGQGGRVVGLRGERERGGGWGGREGDWARVEGRGRLGMRGHREQV